MDDMLSSASKGMVKVIIRVEASMSEQQPKYLRKLVNVTVEDGYKVIRHFACGHTSVFEALQGEADELAAAARKLLGSHDYCAQCAKQGEQQG